MQATTTKASRLRPCAGCWHVSDNRCRQRQQNCGFSMREGSEGPAANVPDRMNDYQVIIAGGGMAGLACALFLARAQIEVGVFDQAQSSLRRVTRDRKSTRLNS